MKNLSRVTSTFLITLFFSFVPFFYPQAANNLEVVINEIAWMGTETSYNDEWLELYNNADSQINLDGWRLIAQDGTPEINLTEAIPAHGFYLLERTDDNTVPDIKSDLIYKGALGNVGENLELYDNFGNLIDRVDCPSGWFAGNNQTKQTMERKSGTESGSDPVNWGTSQNSGGTPKAKNSITIKPSLEEPIIEPETPSQPEPEPQPAEPKPESKPIIYPSGIVINEILPSPLGPDEEEEWIEIFNENGFEVNLSNWQITDTEGKTSTYTFPEGTKIPPKGFLVLSRPTTKITLNNDSDGLNLIQPDGKIIDSVSYEKAPRGQSYNKTESGWVWSSTLTPGSTNIIPTPQVIQPESEKEKSEVQLQKVKEPQAKKGLAAIGEQIPKTSKSLYIFLIALSIAIFSGIIILVLKKKLKNASDID